MIDRFLWSIARDRKVKVKQINDFRIIYDKENDSFFVNVHGYGFNEGVTVFGSKVKTECVSFIEKYSGVKGEIDADNSGPKS